MRRLAGLEQYQVFRFGQPIELFGLGAAQHHRDLAQHVFAARQTALDIFVMRQVGRCHIYRIDILDERVERRVIERDTVAVGEAAGLFDVGIQDSRDLDSAHKPTFGNEPLGNTACADDTQTIGRLGFRTEHRRRNSLRPRQIDYLTELIEIIEFAFPIRPYGKNIDIVTLDVVDLLPYVIFDDDLIRIARLAYGLHALQYVIAHIEFSAFPVETIARDPDDQVVAQFFGPSQKIDMPLVQQIVRAICNHFFHRRPRFSVIIATVRCDDRPYSVTYFSRNAAVLRI